MIEYYQKCFQEKANEKLSDLLLQESPVKIKTGLIKNNATLEVLRHNPSIFLYQSGYLTFANYESSLENPLKITNNEVRSALTESIFETLKIISQFTVGQFEKFLNQAREVLDLSESQNKEAIDAHVIQLRSTLENFFVDSIKEFRTRSGLLIHENTEEKKVTNIFSRFLNNLPWKNWSLAYQPEIFTIEDDIIRKPDFMFSNPKEETEIIIEFMKDNWLGHIEKNYQERTKKCTKKIVIIYYLFKNFDELKRFGISCYRKEKENIKLVFKDEKTF